ncbi:MAG TPA: YkvA family protein [Fibrobacteria bacterium]|nr:YkvA family protein [Fibrobacteria bacterium]
MPGFFRKSLAFAAALSTDARIPARDKAVLAGMLALILSPVDIIPDFIPVLGQLDDAMILILMLDYACNRVPDEVLRDHFPWGPDRLLAWRRRVGFFVRLVPHWVKEKIWVAGKKAEADPSGTAAETAGADTKAR